jgi:hypothetical protein
MLIQHHSRGTLINDIFEKNFYLPPIKIGELWFPAKTKELKVQF